MAPGGPLRVLIVDDDDDLRFLARIKLEADDRFDVVGEGADGLAAVELSRVAKPDLVLLDLEMPWLHGAEAVPLIIRASPRTRIILWTVDPAGLRAADAMELGACALLDKSIYGASGLVDKLLEVAHRTGAGGGQ
jgi:DNA-binding NarL/FixJ family response regulator